MNNFMRNKATRKKMLKISILIVLILLVAMCIVSLLNPYSKFGYRTILFDSKSSTYSNGEDFDYGRYTFNIKTEIAASEVLNLHDCSSLLYKGIFSENSNGAPANQNWWPREDCEKANENAKANAGKSVKVTYKIKNNTSDVRALGKEWLSVLSKDGITIFETEDEVKLLSNGEISGTFSRKLESNKEVGGAVVRLPGLAAQTIN